LGGAIQHPALGLNTNPLSCRILCIGETWLGSNARGAFMALRRLGHSIYIIDEFHYYPLTWRSKPARLLRKLCRPLLVRELKLEARRVAGLFKPRGVFVFKGNSVPPDVIRFYQQRGVPCVNFYPDVSFAVHGRYIPKALPLYDHIFTTKSWGIADMQSQLGVKSVSFLEHGFDPEIHRPLVLSGEDRQRYGCDVVFIGTWSPKKEDLLAALRQALPKAALKVWGCGWQNSHSPELAASIQGDEVIGDEYTKALLGASICLGILSERRKGASSGDLITSRTFNIPACGAFMLHERNEESVRYFEEGVETAFYHDAEELVKKVDHYLANPRERADIAKRGRERCLTSGYSLDERMRAVVGWFETQSLRQ
jgi:glycosyltransferase involved in cell wall biosynthesis